MQSFCAVTGRFEPDIRPDDLLFGDALVTEGSHVILYRGLLRSGNLELPVGRFNLPSWGLPFWNLSGGTACRKGAGLHAAAAVNSLFKCMQVAIKPFPRGSEAEQKLMRREIDILQDAARVCAHTCRMYGTCAKQEGFCVVMKLYEGTLAHAMQKLPGNALCILHLR